jgi:hypothetical protein
MIPCGVAKVPGENYCAEDLILEGCAQGPNGIYDSDQTAANLRLAAAAPQLLEALEASFELLEESIPCLRGDDSPSAKEVCHAHALASSALASARGDVDSGSIENGEDA